MDSVIEDNIRFSKGCVYGCRTNFDGHGWIQGSDSHLEWLETDVFIGENTKFSGLAYAEGDTTGETVFIGTKPGVTLGLFEDVVENGIVSVVVHGGGHRGSWGARGEG